MNLSAMSWVRAHEFFQACVHTDPLQTQENAQSLSLVQAALNCPVYL